MARAVRAVHGAVALIKRINTLLTDGVFLTRLKLGLSAPADAAARAGHHFHEVILLGTGLFHLLNEAPRGGRAVNDGDVNGLASHIKACFTHVLETAHRLQVKKNVRALLMRDEFIGRAKRGFHDATGVAEDDARAGSLTHERIVGAFLDVLVADAALFGPKRQLVRRHHVIDVAHTLNSEVLPCSAHLFTADFVLFGRAGCDHHVHDFLGIKPHLLCKVGLHGRTLHADRALRT